MNKANKTILAVVVVVVLIGAAVILFKPAKSNAPSTNGSNSTNANSNSDSSNKPVAATITYDGNIFTSSAGSVNSGETVKVANTSDKDLEFDSDPHPVHTDNPELNAGDIPAGESKTFTLTEKGSWGYHNHLNSSQKGEITVK
jgi:plastocyanin